MIAVIGEMALSFDKSGSAWEKTFKGLGYEWAMRLKEEGKDVLLITVLPCGKSGNEMAEELVSKGIVFDPDLHLPLNPPIAVDGEWFLRSSSAVALSAEKLTDTLSYFHDIKSVVVSSSLLSYNPASSAVLDSLSFMFPQPEVFIDTSCSESAIGQKEILEKTLNSFSSAMERVLITDSKEEILTALR